MTDKSVQGRTWLPAALGLSGVLVIIDQITKIMVLGTMTPGESISVLGSWLKLTFTENPGMAFGMSFGPPATITVLSVVATIVIAVYFVRIGHIHAPYRYSLASVLGGATGNIIDRVFYGKILYDEPLFLGHVVDFIHVDVWRGWVPDAVPLIGGEYMALFPIWNVADMSIVAGVIGILVFQNAYHRRLEQLTTDETAPEVQDPTT